jgi:membrane protease YdiL (CAAX protease family)
MVTRIILLNALGGIVFGCLYWKKGLEAAIIAHFSADIVLHVLLPLLGRI